MTSEEILNMLTQLVRDIFDNDSIVLKQETTANDIAEWDSFNHINIIVAVESRFKIKFLTAETEELRNVGHFVDLIDKKLKAKAS